MSDNGELKSGQENGKTDKPQIVIQIIRNPDGRYEMNTTMAPPLVVWLFLQFIFSLLADSLGYTKENKIILPHKHGLISFARKMFKGQ